MDEGTCLGCAETTVVGGAETVVGGAEMTVVDVGAEIMVGGSGADTTVAGGGAEITDSGCAAVDGYDSPDGYAGYSHGTVDGYDSTDEVSREPSSPELLEVPFRNLDTGEVMTLSQLSETPVVCAGAARAEAPVLCCGYLWKRGHKLGQLVRRWYVLQHSVGLYYFASAQESVHAPESRRSVELEGAQAVVPPPEAMHGLLVGTALFCIIIQFATPEDTRAKIKELYAEHPEVPHHLHNILPAPPRVLRRRALCQPT